MRFNIVKQSDVSFGTALHYALDWVYGRTSLCGKPMRSTARDGEIGYKRVCGSCAKIMAKHVEAAHAEALEFAEIIAFEQTAVDGMIASGAEQEIAEANVRWFRDAARTLPVSHSSDDETKRYYELMKKHGDAVPFLPKVAEKPVFRIRNGLTGAVRLILGTSPAVNAPHKTVVWVQREGEQGAQPWSADELMSTWHDLVAIDEQGRTNAEAAAGASGGGI